MATPIQSLRIGSQNREEPQVAQNPRLTFSDDLYQVMWSSPVMVTDERGTSVEANTWPDCLRHWEQWQASGGGKAPVTSNRTAPQRQDPFANAHPSHEVSEFMRRG
jgi:hypothetical protein